MQVEFLPIFDYVPCNMVPIKDGFVSNLRWLPEFHNFFSLLRTLEARWCISFLEITSTQSQYKVFKS